MALRGALEGVGMPIGIEGGGNEVSLPIPIIIPSQDEAILERLESFIG